MTTLGWLLGSTAVSILTAVLFIPRELWKRWRLRIVDRLDVALRRKVSRFDRRYRDFMLSSLRFIDIKGLATVGYFTPELDAVFVDVSLAYRAPHQIPEGLLAHRVADGTDRHSITEFLDLPDPMVLAVVGVPGSGKTTLLRHTARELAQSRRRVPILLYLRDHVAKIIETPEVALPTLAPRPAVPEPPGWFEQRLRDGDCVVLLDGLDEVANADDRRAVATWVETQTKRFHQNRFVITSRPQGYRTAPVEGAVVLQVRGFTDDQVSRFVRAWYLAAERHSTGASGEDVRLRAETTATELLDRLNTAPNLYDLTINPLLLTMIANVHRYHGALPGSRVDLYGEICQVMLWRRQEAKKLAVELSGDKKETLLRALAFAMMERRVRDLPRAEILALLKPALRRMSTPMSEEDFLADVSSNGLLIEREPGVYSFAHLTFQEYLAATHVRDKGLVQVLANSVDDSWWRETTLLYAARSDADPIVKACLGSASVPALSLAVDITEQDSELAPMLAQAMIDLLDFPTKDPARLRLRAQVLITRNLREVVRTAAGTRVCARPVSWEVYDLFRARVGAPHPDGPITGPTTPVTGVRAGDAAAFVDWVNWMTDGNPSYRLLRRAEINEPAVLRVLARTPTLSIRLDRDDELGPTLWTPTGDRHTVSTSTIVDYIYSDFDRARPVLTHLLLLRAVIAEQAAFVRFGESRIAEYADYIVDRIAKAITSATYDRSRIFIVDSTSTLEHALAVDWMIDSARILERAATVISSMERKRPFTFRPPERWNQLVMLTVSQGANPDLAHALEFARLLHPVPPPKVSDQFAPIMGIGLSETLANASQCAYVDRVSTDTLAEKLLQYRVDAPEAFQVSLDAMARDLTLVGDSLDRDPDSWAGRVGQRLKEVARPVFSGREPITADTATAIRIAALCLAAEAKKTSPFYEIAACATWLEQRQTGEVPVTEGIMLAIA